METESQTELAKGTFTQEEKEEMLLEAVGDRDTAMTPMEMAFLTTQLL